MKDCTSFHEIMKLSKLKFTTQITITDKRR